MSNPERRVYTVDTLTFEALQEFPVRREVILSKRAIVREGDLKQISQDNFSWQRNIPGRIKFAGDLAIVELRGYSEAFLDHLVNRPDHTRFGYPVTEDGPQKYRVREDKLGVAHFFRPTPGEEASAPQQQTKD